MAYSNNTIDLEIKKLAHDWLDAVRRRDGLELDRILADDFLISGWQPNGQLAGKQFYIEDCLRPVAVEQGSFAFKEWQSRIYGNVAIVNCVLDVSALVNGLPWGGEFSITDVWVREQGAWKAVTRHTSPILSKQE